MMEAVCFISDCEIRADGCVVEVCDLISYGFEGEGGETNKASRYIRINDNA